jgi:hypothetical protein
VKREILWSGVRTPSLDYCSIKKETGGWRFSGLVVVKPQANPFGASYEILVDRTFKVRSLVVDRRPFGLENLMKIEFRRGSWFVNGKEQTDLYECTDVDIEASPVTNTIPIRRTHLKVGQNVDLIVAWVRFPSLVVTPLGQSYKRLSGRKYLYQGASGFSAELEVDDFGLVTRYADIWKELR